MKTIVSILCSVILSFQVGSAFAAEIPNFTTCVNPQGEVKANYETGTHGIAGKTGSFEGKDVVYKLSDNALTQCFCASDGSGIQTNWLKAEAFSEADIKVLESQGWIYIPNGALWGLNNSPYLAENSDFTCKSSSGGNGGPGSNSGSSSSSSSSSSGNSGSGGVLGAATSGVGQVLGLASTGNVVFLLLVSISSGLSLLSGLILKKRVKQSFK